ncbi:phosphatidylserine/phosphatidylglycerophosphate/cardiolipin synthase family protein [Geomicrobium sp. JCM 19039]|uniref:phospholipase D-like domain-containing protein n=1 Tax=Geomicrobium sp. JCM 19039 TaxID=1460636 RepID=UPI00045F1E3D|nr:phospholipase D-like domain-containing protein [Geomicrobium sp. JCM 19039]GAK12121.1 cardiolipin synthetase [Geomicrobium sp. JCM 19039]
MTTAILLSILIIVLLILLLLILDFRGGRADHHKKATTATRTNVRYGYPQLIGDGRAFFEQLKTDIESASQTIHLSFFIWKEPGIGTEVLNLLERRARDGVQVCILVDRLGSSISKSTIQRLRHSGVYFSYIHAPRFPYLFYNLNRRYHRKIGVIDQKIGYIGGFNVGQEYVSKDPKYGFWRDLHVRVEGQIVDDLQQLFLDDWSGAGAPTPLLPQKSMPPGSGEGLQLLYSEGKGVADHLYDWLATAEHSIRIVTPYYVPGKALQDLLIAKQKNGVNVTVLIPAIEDHNFVKAAAYAYIPNLLAAGCGIYQYVEGFYHGKAIIVDKRTALVGSSNFDKRSFHLNDELDLFLPGSPFVQQLVQTLEDDFAGARQLTKADVGNRTLLDRAKTRIARWFSEFL